MRRTRRHSGISLIELLLATAIISFVMIALAAIIQRLGSAQQRRDIKRISQQLAQDKLEVLKTRPFPYLFVTAEEDAPDAGCLAGDLAYDRNPDQYPVELLIRDSMSFRRQTCVEMVRPSSDEGRLIRSDPTFSTGLKRIVVRVRWPSDHPAYEEELESVVSDPVGPMAVAVSSGSFKTKVFCTDGVQDPTPCGRICFYLFDLAGELRDTATSDRDGRLEFLRAPAGPSILRPQLEPGETVDPSEYALFLPWPEHAPAPPSFTITRSNAVIHVSTNRQDTLVVVMPGLPSDRPPDIVLRQDQDTGVYGRIVTDPATLNVSPGLYSVRCWSHGVGSPPRAMDPMGATNVLFTPGSSYAFECHF